MALSGAAAATVVGSVISGDASKSAANTQANSAQNATNAQTALAQQNMANTAALNQPYTSAGATAENKLSSILNGTAGGATGTGAYDITQVPGYQFGLDQGTQAIQNRAGAAGTQLSGNTLRDLQSYGQQYAGQAYNSYLGQLGGLAGMGQASANGQAASQSNTLNGLSSNIGSNLIGAGNAQASGTVGAANAVNGGLGTIANNYNQQQMLSKIFGTGGGTSGGTSSGVTSSTQLANGAINPYTYSMNFDTE